MMTTIPKNHPRYKSLKTREKISDAMKKGIVHETGLIAHGRGEAFDYLIGEKSVYFADEAAKIAAAMLITAKNPVLSINGNVAALVLDEIIELSNEIPAKIEINLFHRTNERIKRINEMFTNKTEKKIYGLKADGLIPGLEHDRGLCDKEGILSSDVVLVPLEDGDRCHALKNLNKKIITIDLNPLSRTSKCADVTIVDNVIRAIPNINKWVKLLKREDEKSIKEISNRWDNAKNLSEVLNFLSKRLNSLF